MTGRPPGKTFKAGSWIHASRTLYVTNVLPGTPTSVLEPLFRDMPGFLAFRKVRTMCFVDFQEKQQATAAMWKTNGHKLKPDHEGLLVSYDKDDSEERGGWSVRAREEERRRRSEAEAARVLYRCSACAHFCFKFSRPLTEMPERKTDGSRVVDMSQDLVSLACVKGQTRLLKRARGVERQYRYNCELCDICVAYRSVPFEEDVRFIYVLPEAVSCSNSTSTSRNSNTVLNGHTSSINKSPSTVLDGNATSTNRNSNGILGGNPTTTNKNSNAILEGNTSSTNNNSNAILEGNTATTSKNSNAILGGNTTTTSKNSNSILGGNTTTTSKNSNAILGSNTSSTNKNSNPILEGNTSSTNRSSNTVLEGNTTSTNRNWNAVLENNLTLTNKQSNAVLEKNMSSTNKLSNIILEGSSDTTLPPKVVVEELPQSTKVERESNIKMESESNTKIERESNLKVERESNIKVETDSNSKTGVENSKDGVSTELGKNMTSGERERGGTPEKDKQGDERIGHNR